MLFPRSARIPFSPSALKAFCIAVLVTTMALPLAAQVTGQPEPDTSQGTSNSSDVQTAKVVQKTPDAYKRDVAVSVFAQYTNVTNGNFIRQDVTSSGGGMVSYRQSPRWWLGYEVNYGYTGYSEAYQKGSYRVKHSANEITAAYLIKSRTLLRGSGLRELWRGGHDLFALHLWRGRSISRMERHPPRRCRSLSTVSAFSTPSGSIWASGPSIGGMSTRRRTSSWSRWIRTACGPPASQRSGCTTASDSWAAAHHGDLAIRYS